jgi:formate hydrogenlyase transcriptional activator
LEQKVTKSRNQSTQYKKNDEDADKRLYFETLVSELSARFINLPTHHIDKEIESGLQLIVEFLGVERGSLFELLEDPKAFNVTHSWAVGGLEPFPLGLLNVDYPWVSEKLLTGELVNFSRADQLPDEAIRDKQRFQKTGLKSALALPLAVGGSIMGAIALGAFRSEQHWPDDLVGRLRFVGEIFANALARKKSEIELQKTLTEIRQLKDQLEDDYTYLREEIKLEHNFEEIIGQSDALKYVLFKVEQVAPTDATVVILGETGTGKELIARALHNASQRKNRPLIKVNCATLPSNLIESELFGHERGAFTSAQARQVGRFELANGATLFLDEIGELPLELQPKLLRALQDGEFERLGSSSTIRTDVRVIAATNRDLEEEVKNGRFRQDLWYRLNVFPLTVPPLRQRVEDIGLLVNAFSKKLGKKLGRQIKAIPSRTIKGLQGYPWPGNIRELENVIERAVITSKDGKLRVEIPTFSNQLANDTMTLEEVEYEHIARTLENTYWKIQGPNGAAERLGLKSSTLRTRMNKLGIKRPKP